MSDTTTLARLEAVVARLEAMGITPKVGITPLTAVDSEGSPGHVVAGELIESAWGNATANSITFLRHHMPWSADGITLAGSWATGLRQIGTQAIPAIPATWTGYNVTFLVMVQYVCVGDVGGGADFSGGTCRTRFRVSPGVDQVITGIRVGHVNQVTVVESLTFSRAAGAPVTNLEIWAETDKPCNVNGSGLVWSIVQGGL